MKNFLQHLDETILFVLNAPHTPFLDEVFWYVSGNVVWIPLYVYLLWLLYKQYGWQNLLKILGVLVLLLICTDQICNVFKNFIQRPRPTHNPDLTWIKTVRDYRGGAFGFVSAHAANTMAVALFLGNLLDKKMCYVLLAWAVLVAYSRTYLGVHYPFDILGGWCLAGILSTLAIWITRKQIIIYNG